MISNNNNTVPVKEARVGVQVFETLAAPNAKLIRLGSAKEAEIRKTLSDRAKLYYSLDGENNSESASIEIGYFGGDVVKLIVVSLKNNDSTLESHIIALEKGKRFEIICIPDESLQKLFKPKDLQCGQKVSELLGASTLTLLES
jgi:hypothetical protein